MTKYIVNTVYIKNYNLAKHLKGKLRNCIYYKFRHVISSFTENFVLLLLNDFGYFLMPARSRALFSETDPDPAK